MGRITLNKTFRSWIELWESLSTDLNTMFTELFYPNKLSAPLVTTPVSTVVVEEYGDGKDMTTILTLTDFVVGYIPAAAAALGVGNIVAAFPAGAHIEDTFYQNLSLKIPGTAVSADVGLGSVVAVGAVSVLSGTSTFEDRLTGQTITTDPAGGTAVVALVRAAVGGISLNVAASVKNIFLNAAGTWHVDNHSDLYATGTIVIKWNKIA